MRELELQRIKEDNYSASNHRQALILFNTVKSLTEKEYNKPSVKAIAAYTLGICYGMGEGVTQNKVAMAQCFEKAAEQGFAEAQCTLGSCYYCEYGVAKDHALAFSWYKRAAEQGLAKAQYNLGCCHHYGHGVGKEDHALAAKWYKKAAGQGHAKAQNNLGVCCDYGRGVAKDYALAAQWYKRAAEQGLAAAKNNAELLGDSRRLSVDINANDHKELAELLGDSRQLDVYNLNGPVSPADCYNHEGDSSRQNRGVKRGASQMSDSTPAICDLSGESESTSSSTPAVCDLSGESESASTSTLVVSDLSGAGVRGKPISHLFPIIPFTEEHPKNSDNSELAPEDDLYQSPQKMRKKIISYLKQNNLSFCHGCVASLMEKNRCSLNLGRKPEEQEDVLQQLFNMYEKRGENQHIFFSVMHLLVTSYFSSEDEFSIDEIKSFKKSLISYKNKSDGNKSYSVPPILYRNTDSHPSEVLINYNIGELIDAVEYSISDLEKHNKNTQCLQQTDTPASASRCERSSSDKSMEINGDKREEVETKPNCKRPCETNLSQERAEKKAKTDILSKEANIMLISNAENKKEPDNSIPASSISLARNGALPSREEAYLEPKVGGAESSRSVTPVNIENFFTGAATLQSGATNATSSSNTQDTQDSKEEHRVVPDASNTKSDQPEDPLSNRADMFTTIDKLAKVLGSSGDDQEVDYCYAEYLDSASNDANKRNTENYYIDYLTYADDEAQWSTIASRISQGNYRAENNNSVSEQINNDLDQCLEIVERLKTFLVTIKNKVSINLGKHLRVKINNHTADHLGISVTVLGYCIRVISFCHKLKESLKSLQEKFSVDLEKNKLDLISSITSFSDKEGEGLGLLFSQAMMKTDMCFNIDDLNGLINNDSDAVSFWYYLLTIHPEYLFIVDERYDRVAGMLEKLTRLGFGQGLGSNANKKTRAQKMHGTYYHPVPGKDKTVRVIPSQFSGAWDIKYNEEEGQTIKVQSINYFKSLRSPRSKAVPAIYSPQKNKEQDHLGRLLGGKFMDPMLCITLDTFPNWSEGYKRDARKSYSSGKLEENGTLSFMAGMRKGFWAQQQYRNSKYEFWASILFARSLEKNISFPLNGDTVSCHNLIQKTVVEPADLNEIMIGALKLYLNGMDLKAVSLWLCVSGMSTLGSLSTMTINCGGAQEVARVYTCFSTISLGVKETHNKTEQEQEQKRLAGLLSEVVVNGLAGGFGD